MPRSRALALTLALAALGACGHAAPHALDKPPSDARAPLRSPADFASIADPQARSRAIFGEMTRVLFHPRCVNCHPSDDVPRQGDRGALHDPPVVRGPDDHGVAGMECTGCHQDRNLELARVPGAIKWALAPRSMAWMHQSPAHVCEQLKDPKRNGGKSLAQIVDHSAHDGLVAWGWSPGADREPAPGTQAAFGALVAAWVETGADCPPEGEHP